MTSHRQSLIGAAIPRIEDARFISGHGIYADDLQFEGTLHSHIVRSSWAHGKIQQIDVDAVRQMPGVRLVLTGADLEAAGLALVPVDLPPPGATFESWTATPQPVLANETVRYVGDPVAFIVADTIEQAKTAAESFVIDVEEAEPLTDLLLADPDFVYEEGDAARTRAAIASAHQVVQAQLPVHRVDAFPLEPRGCLATYGDSIFTLYVSTQRVQILQRALADRVFKVPRDRFRVVAPDTGGGFGQKNGLYPEYVLCVEAARRLQRPVKWIPDRSEVLSAGCHARDNHFSVSAALDQKGRITAIEATRRLNMGAYVSSRGMVPVQNGLTHLTGVYAIPTAHVRVEGVFTNTAPTCSYRGAGRPENVYACERLIDMVARSSGMDPISWRRANLLKRAELPWVSPLGTHFDDQDFAGLLDAALAKLDHAGFEHRRAKAARSGRARGFGVALFAEELHGSHEPFPARIELVHDRLEVVVGTGSAGHGHETTFLQIVASRLGIPIEALVFRQSDTFRMAEGAGTAASWSLTLGGSSVQLAADAAVEKGQDIAEDLLEASRDDVRFEQGRFFVIGTDRSIGWKDIFNAVPNFAVSAVFNGTGQTVNSSCHACEVEIDLETGSWRLLDYAIAQDSGLVVNPMIFVGQLHGGLAQGLGQTLMEGIVYEASSGQLTSGSLMDYALPRASDMPAVHAALFATPAQDNPLGVKGVGESAATGAPVAAANAIMDALWRFGVLHLDPPLTAQKIWEAVRSQK